MKILLLIGLGMLIWQFLVFMVLVISGEDEEKTLYSAIGVFGLVCICLRPIIEKVSLLAARKYNLYQFYGKISESTWDTKADKFITSFYMTAKTASQFAPIEKGGDLKQDYCVRLLREGKEFKSAPYKGDILTQEKINQGCGDHGFSKDFLAKFKKGIDK